MTDDEIRVIETRAIAASPGPWEAILTDERSEAEVHSVDGLIFHTKVELLNNAMFIAHARQDVPKLIAALREARADLDDAQRVIRQLIGRSRGWDRDK